MAAVVMSAIASLTPQRAQSEHRPAAATGFEAELAKRLGNPTTTPNPRLVTPTKTPLTGSEAASALSSAWQRVTGHAPSPKMLSVLVAQWSHETGRGRAMLNYNFGGLKGQSAEGLSAAYRTHEGTGDSERT